MLWLAAHMWFLLIGAFCMGLGVGWWAWGGKAAEKPASQQPADTNAPLGTLDHDDYPASETKAAE
ncbi:MAG: hypothetical protein KJN99_06770 [Marinicaulis sp.]|nr:hypothetical protein [Marinicaulis sp.]